MRTARVGTLVWGRVGACPERSRRNPSGRAKLDNPLSPCGDGLCLCRNGNARVGRASRPFRRSRPFAGAPRLAPFETWESNPAELDPKMSPNSRACSDAKTKKMDGGWPTFMFFLKVETHAVAGTIFNFASRRLIRTAPFPQGRTPIWPLLRQRKAVTADLIVPTLTMSIKVGQPREQHSTRFVCVRHGPAPHTHRRSSTKSCGCDSSEFNKSLTRT